MGRPKGSPNRSDDERTAAHLAQTIADNLGHVTRHMAAANQAKDEESKAFNQKHMVNHVASARAHARKLADHLAKHPALNKEIEALQDAQKAASKKS